MFRLSCAPTPRDFGLVVVVLEGLRLAQAHWDEQRSKRTHGSRLGTLDNGGLTPNGSARQDTGVRPWRVSGMVGLRCANGLPGSGSDGATSAFAPAMAGLHGAAGGARWRAGGHEDGALKGRERHK